MTVAARPDPRALTEARDDLAAAMLGAIPAHEQTLVLHLLARGFVSAYADALSQRRPQSAVAWVDRMCAAYADAPHIAQLFESACDSFETFFSDQRFGEAYRAPLRKLRASLRATVRKARVLPLAAIDRFDEVNAAISEAIVRLERADPLTAEHSRAVGAWCARIARRLKLSEADTLFVSRCGKIHDIGKVTTPAGILHAPRSLDDAEWAVMRDHTLAGEKIVREDARLRQFAPAVRSHHERLDGRGYPDRIEGDAIGWSVRIVTVADCFNAMIGRRPYRPSMPPMHALDQLNKGAGTQFDVEVVAAMQAVVGRD